MTHSKSQTASNFFLCIVFLLVTFISISDLNASTNTNSNSNSNSTNCYRFEMTNSPDRTASNESIEHETWCYQKLTQPAGAIFIYNADDERAKPELSILVEPDGSLIHGSLVRGQVTAHHVFTSGFNPFSIPLSEPEQMPVDFAYRTSSFFQSSVQEVLKFLLTSAPEAVSLAVLPGQLIESVPVASLPWRGYWWAYKGQTLSGHNQSVLAKFDRYVQGQTGKNPGAQAWENAFHRYSGTTWEGHCNGWAASSIIRAEPKFSLRDPKTGIVFKVADQKGILSEKDYCVKLTFFGKRYRGNPGDDPQDIYPSDFHQALTYYIGNLGKPVAIDDRANESVRNNIISGYQMNIKQIGSNTYAVSATLNIHRYDEKPDHVPGVAPSYKKIYQYTLQTDQSGAIVGGNWKSENPDFLWVPLSPTECRKNNPLVTGQWTDKIMNLPKAIQ